MLGGNLYGHSLWKKQRRFHLLFLNDMISAISESTFSLRKTISVSKEHIDFPNPFPSAYKTCDILRAFFTKVVASGNYCDKSLNTRT